MNPEIALEKMRGKRCRRSGGVVNGSLPQHCPMLLKNTMQMLVQAKDEAFGELHDYNGHGGPVQRLKEIRACEDCICSLGQTHKPENRGRRTRRGFEA